VVGKRQAADDVAAQVRDLIVAGEFRPGQFLRLEPLAQKMGTSVTPVREAMVLLRGEGFVDLEPNRGFVVLPLSPRDIEDIYRVHAFVSGELAALAARRLTAEAVDDLAALQQELERAFADGLDTRVEELNHAFHRAINRAAGSPRLIWFLRSASRYAPRMFFARIEGWAGASAHDHQAILRALQEHNPESARAAMTDHVHNAGRLLARHHDTRWKP
jgi:DNA-binding GntR family transcriptional regulator